MPTVQRVDHDAVSVLRLDRPERRNAMDSALLAELLDALEELAARDDLRALVFSTTSEQALSAGADVAEQLDDAAGVARMEAFTRLYAAVEAFPVPTVAVCVGNVVGAGAELAAGLRPARGRRQPQAGLGRRPPRRARGPGAAGAAGGPQPGQGAGLHRPRGRRRGGRGDRLPEPRRARRPRRGVGAGAGRPGGGGQPGGRCASSRRCSAGWAATPSGWPTRTSC